MTGKPHRRAEKAEHEADRARRNDEPPVPPVRVDPDRLEWWTPRPTSRRGAKKPKSKKLTYTPPSWRGGRE
jgi:hypothetical protein